jgi:hypothetical protein
MQQEFEVTDVVVVRGMRGTIRFKGDINMVQHIF